MKIFKKISQLFMFIILLSPMKLYANSIHQNLKLELFKNEVTKINGILKFEKNKDSYNIIFQIPEEDLEIPLDKQSIKKLVKSVFLYDMNRDGVKEIFIIYNENGKNSIEGYSISNLYMEEEDYHEQEDIDFFKTLNIATAKKLNTKIANIDGFNADLAKNELDKLIPYYKVVNFNTFDIWDVLKKVGEDEYYRKGYLYKYELLPQDYERFNLQKYFKIYSLENLNFIKYMNSNTVLYSNGKYYFLFQIHRLGLITLEEVFQGKITDELNIKNGMYFNPYENGYYENNVKIGPWNSYKYSDELNRYLPVKKYFSKGVLTRKDTLYRRLSKLYTFSSTFYSPKGEIEKIEYYDPDGKISQIKTYKNSILEKVVNYTHYKRDYSIYDKVVNPKTGYESYKNRESLTLFKNIDIINAKLENEQLNLYSIKSENGKEIFIKFQNYSPKNSYLEGIRWHDDIFKHFGIDEIFYGKRKNEKIESLDDVIKDGYFEKFSPGSFPGVNSILDSQRNVESVVETGYFKTGVKNGLWKTYDRHRGDLLTTSTYVNGVLEGPYELYEVDNILRENGEHKNGVKTILWKAPPMFLFSQ